MTQKSENNPSVLDVFYVFRGFPEGGISLFGMVQNTPILGNTSTAIPSSK